MNTDSDAEMTMSAFALSIYIRKSRKTAVTNIGKTSRLTKAEREVYEAVLHLNYICLKTYNNIIL